MSRIAPGICIGNFIAYRIIQEALTNVARHAGVNTAKVRVSTQKTSLRIEVRDEGKGFDLGMMHAINGASGLHSMRERALSLGGELRVKSVPGEGTCLTAVMPFVTLPTKPE